MSQEIKTNYSPSFGSSSLICFLTKRALFPKQSMSLWKPNLMHSAAISCKHDPIPLDGYSLEHFCRCLLLIMLASAVGNVKMRVDNEQWRRCRIEDMFGNTPIVQALQSGSPMGRHH